MREKIKRLIPRKIFFAIRSLVYPEQIGVIEEAAKRHFITSFSAIASPRLNQKIAFRNAEFKVFSKHGQDGILAYIFSKIGAHSHTFVEMGIEDGRECNTANLARNFGWQGLMIDANEAWVGSAMEFFKDYEVEVVHSFVTAENINETVAKLGKKEIDLLSIDIDGNDYWVWKAISAVNPRVVVLEYNASFGLHSVTQRYTPERKFNPAEHPLFFGASLSALAKLSKEKGYILAACDTHGHDAFFIRQDAAAGNLTELTPEEAFYPNPFTLKKFGSIDEQFELVRGLDLVEI